MSLILSQAERRLSDQASFAAAADARAATVTSAAAAIATAGVGAFAAALSSGVNWPLAVGSAVCVLGFGHAARRALQSARTAMFHPAGYRPRDFAFDITGNHPIEQTHAEMAEDLDERLEFNSGILAQRGGLIDGAMDALWMTPAVAAVAAGVTAAFEAMLRATI